MTSAFLRATALWTLPPVPFLLTATGRAYILPVDLYKKEL
jgi:hypothetical protein